MRTIILLLKALIPGRIKLLSIYTSINVGYKTLGSLTSWATSKRLCTRFCVGISHFWMHCHRKKWPLPQWSLAPLDSYRSVRRLLSVDTGVPVAWDDTRIGTDWADNFQIQQGKGKLEALFILFIFTCLYLSKAPWFLLFPTSPKYSIVSLAQSSNALPVCLIMCHTPPASKPLQSARWSRDSVPFFVPVCPSFPDMHQESHIHVDSVKLCDKRLFCTFTWKENRSAMAGGWTRITPLRKFISYNKDNVSRLPGMLRLNPKQLHSTMLA